MKLKFYTTVIIWMSISLASRGQDDQRQTAETYATYLENCSLVVTHGLNPEISYNLQLITLDNKAIEFSSQMGNSIVLPGIEPKTIASIIFTDPNTRQQQELHNMEDVLKLECPEKLTFNPSTARGTCGTGFVNNYLNCDGEFHDIDKSYLEQDMYVHVDDDYITCIAHVDDNCTIGESFRTFCTYYPYASAGDYPLGFIHYEKVIGLVDFNAATGFGVTDKQGEEINWVLCHARDLGYSYSQMNAAIWGILDQVSCNGLCNIARDAIVNPTGLISPHLEFYVPLTGNNVQPQVRNQCYTPGDEPIIYLCEEEKQIDTYVKGLLDQTPSNRYIDIPNPGNVERLVAEVWIEPNECPNNAIAGTIGLRGENGASTPIEVTAAGIPAIQTSTSATIENIYRYTFEGSFGRISVLEDEDGGCDPSSIAVYVVRSNGSGVSALNTSINREFHRSEHEFTMDVGSAAVARDMVLSVPIHEKGDNNRIARVEAWYNGGPVVSGESTMATSGLEASLIELTLTAVPANIELINVKIISPDNTDGESFGVGAVSIKSELACCPTVTATGGLVGCGSNNVTLTSSTLMDSPAYSWTGPGGFVSTLANPVVSTTGIYTLTVSDANSGCVASDTALVSGGTNPANCSVSNNGPITCSSPSVFLDGESTTQGATYSWTGPNGFSVNTENTVTSVPGTYILTVNSPSGCPSTCTTLVEIDTLSYSTLISATICTGQTYYLPDGSPVNTAGTYPLVYQTYLGCDSVITTVLNVLPAATSSQSFTICSGESITLPGGQTVSSGGTYTDILTTTDGCDSIVTTVITEYPAYNESETVTICDGQSYTLPDGSTVTAPGTYTNSFTTIHGCDSVFTTVLIVQPEYILTVNATICDGESYTLPDGSSVTSAGTYVESTTTNAGCDSIITTILTVAYPFSDSVDITICDGQSYTLPGGTIVTTAGTYVDDLTTVAGCDSVIVTVVDVIPAYTVSESAAICAGSSYTLPDGQVVTTPGTYVVTLTTGTGCDSIITTTLGVVADFNYTQDVLLCQGNSYVLPSGVSTWSAGTYVDSFTAAGGCDSIITTIIVVAPSYNHEVRDTICDGDDYVLPSGVVVTTAGVYINYFDTFQECDSIITTYLVVLPRYEDILPITICSGDSYTMADGTVVNTGGYFGDTFTTVLGCDSLVLTLVTILPIYDEVRNVEICSGSSYTLPGGTVVSSAGTYTDTLTSSAGCDSTVTIILDLVPFFNVNVAEEICMGESYTLPDGSDVFLPGTFVDTLTATGGCDSIVKVILDVLPNYNIAVPASICIGDAYTLPDGSTVTTGGIYIDSLLTSEGCDSIITTTLTVVPLYDVVYNAVICDGDSYVAPGGSIHTSAGTFTDSIFTTTGCDSIVTIILDVEYPSHDTVNASICLGDTYVLPGGTAVNVSGTYTDSFLTAGGCDSVITTILNVVDNADVTIVASICVGEIYILPDGGGTGIGGTFVDSLISSIGCDSVVTTILTVGLPYEQTETTTICAGDSLMLADGNFVSTAGTYIDSALTINGCDSITTIILEVNDRYNESVDVLICDGDSYTLPGGNLVDSAGTYTDSLFTSTGCDSIITTTVDVAFGSEESVNVTICDDDYYTLPDGNVVITPGTYVIILSTVDGCDSVITTILDMVPEYNVWNQYDLCEGESVALPGGDIVSTAGNYVDTLISLGGCDSIIRTEIIFRPLYQHSLSAGICDGGSYTLPDGSVVSTPGTYTNTLQTIYGCDSVITTVLTIASGMDQTVDVVMCDGQFYTLPNGEVESHAGTYVDTLYSALGCDSIITTNISLLPHTTSEIDEFVCDANMYILESGDTVTSPGTYLYVIENHDGCDSSIYATVIFSSSVDTSFEATICEGEPYILPGGDTTYTAGIYIDSLQTAAGCDSIITVDLTVLPSYSLNMSASICDGDTYVLPDGQSVSTGGTYVTVLSTSLGCDSTITTEIIANPTYHIVNNYSICPGDSVILPIGLTVYSDTLLEMNHSTYLGCDSTVVFDVRSRYHSEHEFDYIACGVESVTIADFTYDESGTYIINHTNHLGCDSVVTLNLVLNQPFATTIDTVLCPGNTVTIAGQVFDAQGEYIVHFSNYYGCDSTYFVNIEYVNVPEVTARHDTTIIQGAEVEAYMLDHSVDRPLEFTWTINDTIVVPGVERFIKNYWYESTIKIMIRDTNNCVAEDAFRIMVEEECPDDLIFAPNIITPNYDNANDVFDILNPHQVIINEVAIFNRWGEMVHHAKDFETPWDGRFRGMDLDPDVYTYFIQGTCASGNQLLKKGNITLIR